MERETVNKPSQIDLARRTKIIERSKEMATQKSLHPVMKTPKYANKHIMETFNMLRNEYIHSYCNDLRFNNFFTNRAVDIIEELMIEDNVCIDKYLIKDPSYDYYYTVFVIYLMYLSKNFDEDDYYKVGEMKFNNPFHAKWYYDKLLKEKKEEDTF